MSDNVENGKTKISIQKIIPIGGIITAFFTLLGVIIPVILESCAEERSRERTLTAEA
jgi:hypothetical protein